MNIFATDPCPIRSAAALDDKRVIKMILETAQLLSTSITLCGGQGPYKVTHKNHPCAVWARTSKANYKWLLDHFFSLTKVYVFAYDKVHKCTYHWTEFQKGIDLMPDGELTPFANCAANNSKGINFKHMEVHEAYKHYLEERWKSDVRKPRWTNRPAPKWEL